MTQKRTTASRFTEMASVPLWHGGVTAEGSVERQEGVAGDWEESIDEPAQGEV